MPSLCSSALWLCGVKKKRKSQQQQPMASRQQPVNLMAAATSTLEACEYACGSCGKINKLKPSDAVRCQFCAYRILYKQRAKKVLQYEAS